jgi:hypothetical protein
MRAEKSHIDARLDEALKETFPASDPSAKTGVYGIKADMPPRGKLKGRAAKK